MKLNSGDSYRAIGFMSGTSLDGMDLVAVTFEKTDRWMFRIHFADTVPYSEKWLERLTQAPAMSGEQLAELDAAYGSLIGSEIKKFITSTGFKPELIASHGHTVFHRPESGYTLQIGNGAGIAAESEITTIANFRITDVALGGQGAPLVPIGDQLLFPEYDYCLNLGGFSNISQLDGNRRIAYDICPVNIILNHYAKKQGLLYDSNGNMGRKGAVNEHLLNQLNEIPYYSQAAPKSLGREWLDDTFWPVLDRVSDADSNKLRTIYEHIAIQIGKSLRKGRVLVTGGGAFNQFLFERIENYSSAQIILPESLIINYKEALIFAFLGVLRIRDEINCLSSVTGARRDSCAGLIFDP